jgi:protease-4
MKGLFGRIGAALTALRIWTINLLTLVVVVYLVVIVVGVIRSTPGKVDPEGRVLILNPQGLVLDQEAFPSEVPFPPSLDNENQVQSRDLIRTIRAAAADERIAGVLLDFSKARFTGPSTALRIADELGALRGAGKPVIAYSESLGTGAYMMAAQADEIYVHPSGAVAISGPGGYRYYTRAMTDKLKIKIHNYSQGDYKSAVEGLTRNDMSDFDRRQREELIAPVWAAMKQRMAQARGVEASVFQTLADDYPTALISEAAYDNLAYAREQGIIDGTKSYPEFRAWMIEKFGRDEDDERETYPHIGGDAYFAQLEPEETDTEEAVAVVFAEGVIQPGDLAPGVAGSDDVSRLIRQAYEDENTRAIVLRVNSPGGSIIASDIIRDELLAAKERGLPVVISMGDLAASGGMWISTPADTIYAEPTTITGSIGVAIAFPTVEDSLDHIGVHFDGVAMSDYAGWNPALPVDEKLDAIFARFGSSAYQRFVGIVAESRGKDVEYIRSIAGGRVWLGSRGRELGLVDELGTMEDAIGAAADKAGLDIYRVNYVVKQPSFGYALLRRFSASIGGGVSTEYAVYFERLGAVLEMLGRVSQPTATVMCDNCRLELN